MQVNQHLINVVFRSGGSYSLPASLVKLMNCTINWHIAVTRYHTLKHCSLMVSHFVRAKCCLVLVIGTIVLFKKNCNVY